MEVFKDDGSIFQEILMEYKSVEDLFKTVIENIARSIGVNYEESTAESKVIVNELLLQGMMYLDDTERELLLLKYGLKLEHNVIAGIIGISKEEVEEQSITCREKFERMLKGEL